MIIELSINGARVIVAGENLSVSMTEDGTDAKVIATKPSAPRASKPETAAPVITPSKTEFVMRPAKPLRPYCQKPGSELCGGSGHRHCQPCTKLMAEQGEAA